MGLVPRKGESRCSRSERLSVAAPRPSGEETMTPQRRRPGLKRRLSVLLLLGGLGLNLVFAQSKSELHSSVNSPCRVEPADYKGWHAQRLSNRWVQLIVLPQ